MKRRTKPTPKLDANGLRDKRQWPKLPADHQHVIAGYLMWWRVQAEYAAERAAELAAVSTEDVGSLGTLAYWQHVVRAIDWLLYHVPHRQQYLEITLAMEEGRWTGPKTAPDT